MAKIKLSFRFEDDCGLCARARAAIPARALGPGHSWRWLRPCQSSQVLLEGQGSTEYWELISAWLLLLPIGQYTIYVYYVYKYWNKGQYISMSILIVASSLSRKGAVFKAQCSCCYCRGIEDWVLGTSAHGWKFFYHLLRENPAWFQGDCGSFFHFLRACDKVSGIHLTLCKGRFTFRNVRVLKFCTQF